MKHLPPKSPLFPYTTLFRSQTPHWLGASSTIGERAVITLYSFGPGFGLPDPSPFVMKVEILLKMAKLPYRSRSEEHTSELQSRLHLVCRLLLEKKKNIIYQ